MQMKRKGLPGDRHLETTRLPCRAWAAGNRRCGVCRPAVVIKHGAVRHRDLQTKRRLREDACQQRAVGAGASACGAMRADGGFAERISHAVVQSLSGCEG